MSWEILEHPLVVVFASFIFGTVLASAISARWQRRAQRHAVRLDLLQDLLRCYQEYVRYLNREDSLADSKEFDRLHSEFLSRSKMAKVMFGERVHQDLNQ